MHWSVMSVHIVLVWGNEREDDLGVDHTVHLDLTDEARHVPVHAASKHRLEFQAHLDWEQIPKHSQNNKQAFINSAIYTYIGA